MGREGVVDGGVVDNGAVDGGVVDNGAVKNTRDNRVDNTVDDRMQNDVSNTPINHPTNHHPTPLDLTERLPMPTGAETAETERAAAAAELATLQEESELSPCAEEEKSLQKEVAELTARREALRRELEAVETQLVDRTRRLAATSERVRETTKRVEGRRRALEQREAVMARGRDDAQKAAATVATAAACRAVREDMAAAQKTSAELVKAVGDTAVLLDRTALLRAVSEYLESEVTCVNFLEDRATLNRTEADRLSQELQHGHHGVESTLDVAKMRRSVASDLEAANALRRFATEVERLCAGIVDDSTDRELLRVVYALFGKLHVAPTLKEPMYSVVKPIVEAATPKGLDYCGCSHAVIAKRKAAVPVAKSVRAAEKTGKEPKPVRATGKKWNVVKPIEVKSLSEIQKEVERK